MDSPFPHDPPSRYAYPPADPDAMEPDIDAMLDGALGSYGQTDEGPDGDFRNEDVRLLAQAWANEKQAPELLPYEDQLVGDLTEMVQNQLQLIEAVQEENSDQAFLAMLYQHEVERVKFVLRSYLKTRLRKLERHVLWYTASNDYQVRMAPGERAFAARYRALFTSHMQRACLNHLPESLRALDDTNGNVSMISTPHLMTAVICRVLEDIGEFAITDTETVDMRKDSIFLVSYGSVQTLLAERQIELV